MLKNYHVRLIVDGYHTYHLLLPGLVQCCTVHIGRDLKKWAEGKAKMTPHRRITRNFAKMVRSLILEAKDLKKKGRGPEMYDAMYARLDVVLKYYSRYPEIEKYVGYVRDTGRHIFMFTNYDYVDSDNNLAERAMREVVKHRVMKSLLRTNEWPTIFAILLTVMMTYKSGGVLEVLKKYMARGRESGSTPQTETANHTSDAPGMPPEGGYG